MENRVKVLIVDDNVDTVELLTKRFAAAGYARLLPPMTGKRHCRVVRECLPDLIVLDIMMPKIDGLGGLPAAQGR